MIFSAENSAKIDGFQWQTLIKNGTAKHCTCISFLEIILNDDDDLWID